MTAQRSTTGCERAIDSPGRRRLPLLLRRAWYGLNRAFRRRITHLGVTPDQFTVMRTLLENEGITQREIDLMYKTNPAKLLNLPPPEVAALNK